MHRITHALNLKFAIGLLQIVFTKDHKFNLLLNGQWPEPLPLRHLIWNPKKLPFPWSQTIEHRLIPHLQLFKFLFVFYLFVLVLPVLTQIILHGLLELIFNARIVLESEIPNPRYYLLNSYVGLFLADA